MVNMPKRYFKLAVDMSVKGRWSLGMLADLQGRELDDPWTFTDGRLLPDPGRLTLPVTNPGRAVDFSYGGIATPVVHPRVASVFAQLAPEDVQLFPVWIEGQPEPFCVLVANKLIRCIDNEACEEVQIWTPEDGRPEKVGQYRDIWGLRIAPSKVADSKVFRTWGWHIALIVREEIRDALERLGATGMKLEEV
ncbi:hypothetical protein COSO111634_31595 [Corallococcus soli]